MNKEILAYTAGLVDGEGSFSITNDPDGRHYLRVSVVNTYEPVCSWLVQHFGGNYVQAKDAWRIKHGHKPCYAWTISGAKAKEFAQVIAPFLIIKRNRAELLLDFPVKTNGVHCTPGEKKKRQGLYLRLKELNR